MQDFRIWSAGKRSTAAGVFDNPGGGLALAIAEGENPDNPEVPWKHPTLHLDIDFCPKDG